MKKGFILTELILAIVLIALISLFIIGVFYTNTRIYQKQQADIKLSGSARFIIDEINKNIKEAKAYKNSFQSGGDSYTSNVGISGDDTLIIALPPIDSNNNPIETTGELDHIVYYKDGNNLVKKVYPVSGVSARESTSQILTINTQTVQFSAVELQFPKCADVNFDGVVDSTDTQLVQLHFGTYQGGPPNSGGYSYDPIYDLRGAGAGQLEPDGVIASNDIFESTIQNGSVCPRVFVRTDLTLEEQTPTQTVEHSQSGEALFRNR